MDDKLTPLVLLAVGPACHRVHLLLPHGHILLGAARSPRPGAARPRRPPDEPRAAAAAPLARPVPVPLAPAVRRPPLARPVPVLLAVPLLGSGRRGRAAARLGRPRLGPPLLPLPRARRCHPLGARPRPRPCSSPRAASPARRSPTAPRRLAPRGLAPSETDARRRRSGSGWSARFGRTTPTRIYAAYTSLGLNPTRMNLKPNTGPTGSNPSQPSWTLQPNTARDRGPRGGEGR